MIADLHCHYPMHLLEKEAPPDVTLKPLVRVRHRPWLEKLRAAILSVAARLVNFRHFWDAWRVNLDRLERGDVRLVFSVLYVPDAEMDSDQWPGGEPADHYFGELIERLEQVEREVGRIDSDQTRHLIVKRPPDLEAVVASKRVGIIHCVEGGFHLGRTLSEIDERVAMLAERGVVYITLAHLFWRQVATNVPAIPFFSDRLYDRLFPQPAGAGLTELGRAAVRAMYEHRVLIDLSHMRQDAIDETFELLEELDHEHGAKPSEFPLIATHAGFRFGAQAYMLSPETIGRIAGRDGVIGLIMARHQLNDGLPDVATDDLERTVQTIRSHIDKIHQHAGSHHHVGIGSDLDGFIKPTVGGIEYADDLGKLAGPLQAAYPDDAEAILCGNAMRVLGRALAARG
jgi:microsomal dipeptidase-like Zn-dependent dipeptidase